MNWGYKILLVYAVFVLGIMFLVFKSSSQKVDLVTTDYYAKELKYQQKINAMNRVQDLSDTVKYEMDKGKVIIEFPKDFSGTLVTGNVVLYCPSDENKDISQDFSVRNLRIMVPVNESNKGLYELQLSWQVNDVSYYFEKKLMLH